MFLHDNAKSYSARITQEKILDFGWSVLPHPLYLPDLTLSDFYLFPAVQNALNDKKKLSQEYQMKMFMENLFSLKAAEFT